MRTIVRIRFGSHLYGTDTPQSDFDFKSVFVPSARDILLQRVSGSVSAKRPKAEGERNVAGEVDEEAYSLQRYLGLVAEGQTVALDVLFAPRSMAVGESSWEWTVIESNRHLLITKKSAAFIGYCRTQANKYGIKGSRIAAARSALELLSNLLRRYGPLVRLADVSETIEVSLTEHPEHMQVLDIEGGTEVDGVRCTVRHWEVCDRKMPYTQTIKGARDVVQRIVDNYGHRALQAESNQGVDWKALSHAVRVGRQAIELLATGHVTFPRPEREHLVAIKTGVLEYAPVAEEIEGLLVEVEEAAARSKLPDESDHEWINHLVETVYRREVMS